MKVLVVGGFLGSGKTSTILRLGREFSKAGKKVAIIVNEIGEIGLDGDVISKYGLDTTELTNGCICCTLKVSMKTTISLLYKNYNPDILLVEPTGIAFPHVIKEDVKLMNLDGVTVQPLVTLIDGSRFKQLMKEVKNFAMRQIIDAEILGINKVDLIEEIRIPILEESVQQLNPKAKVILLSASKADEHWYDFVELAMGDVPVREETDQSVSEIPEEESDEVPMEADLNSITASGISSYATEYKLTEGITPDMAKEVSGEVMDSLKRKVIELSPEFVGHIKLFVESDSNTIKTNLTGFDQDITTELIDTATEGLPRLKILSAVSSIDRETLANIVNETISEKLSKQNIDFSHEKTHDHDHDHGHAKPIDIIKNN